MTSISVIELTRRGLHTLAEALLAGPQHASHGTIRLTVDTTGDGVTIKTTKGQVVSLDAGGLHGPRGSIELARVTTAREAGAVVGLPVEVSGMYGETSGLAHDHLLEIDPEAAGQLLEWFGLGARALAAFAPDHTAVLWPEHFDLAISVASVNYGVSPGDDAYPEPYAYVGPWTVPDDPFFTAPFGALRTWEEVRDPASIMVFFDAGRRVAGGS